MSSYLGGPDYDADDVEAVNEPQEDATDAQAESVQILAETPPGFEEENKDSVVKFDPKKKCWYTR